MDPIHQESKSAGPTWRHEKSENVVTSLCFLLEHCTGFSHDLPDQTSDLRSTVEGALSDALKLFCDAAGEAPEIDAPGVRSTWSPDLVKYLCDHPDKCEETLKIVSSKDYKDDYYAHLPGGVAVIDGQPETVLTALLSEPETARATPLGELQRDTEALVEIDGDRNVAMFKTKHYEVDLDRINSERDLLSWIEHMARKSWMPVKALRQFVTVVATRKGFFPHRLP